MHLKPSFLAIIARIMGVFRQSADSRYYKKMKQHIIILILLIIAYAFVKCRNR